MNKTGDESMSIVFKDDQPYIQAAQKELGDKALLEEVGELARKLKSQDEYLADIIKCNSGRV